MLDTLTQGEQEKVIIQLAKGQQIFTEEDGMKALDWASKAMLEKILLEIVLNGKLIISIKNGEINFQKPLYSSNP